MNEPNLYQHRIGAYVRISPTDEVNEEGSLVSHPQQIKQWLQWHNMKEKSWGKIVDFYVDPEHSGKDLNRPQFKRMLQDIKMGRINAVVCIDLSRFGRNLEDFCAVWNFLKKQKASFFSVRENFDTSTLEGEMMLMGVMNFNQYERKRIVKRIKDNVHLKALRGLNNGARPILGFDLNPHKKGHYVPNKKEVAEVIEIFKLFQKLGSIRETVRYLNENGYRTKEYVGANAKRHGGLLYSHSILHRILTNYAYIGKREIKKANKYKPDQDFAEQDKYRVVDAVWPAILPENLFFEVQEKLSYNYERSKNRLIGSKKYPYLLTPFVYCGECGLPLRGAGGTGRKDGNKFKFTYYIHGRNKGLKKPCSFKSVSAPDLEQFIIRRLNEIKNNKSFLIEMAQNLKRESSIQINHVDDLLQNKEEELKTIRNRTQTLIRKLEELPEGMSGASIYERLDELDKQKSQLLDNIEKLKAEQSQRSTVIDVKPLFEILKAIQRDFSKLPLEVQRNILKDIIEHIEVFAHQIRITYVTGSREISRVSVDEILGKNLVSSNAGTFWPRVRPLSRMVDLIGIEPTTSSMPLKRSPK